MLFSKSNIYAKDWLDTIFAGRNKDYGAYELRQLAPKATNMALGIVVAAVVGICGIAYAKSNSASVQPQPTTEEELIPMIIDDNVIVEMEAPVEQSETDEQPRQVAQDVPAQDVVRFTEINATDVSHVSEDMDAVLDRKKLPGNITMDGIKGGELIPKGTFGTTTREGGERGVRNGSPIGDPDGTNEAFVNVEIMPEPVDGMKAFVQWVADNYDFPQGALDSGTKGLIQISFVVEKDGSLSSFEVVRDMGYNTGTAAINLLKTARKWNPGIQNGRPVRVAFTLPIRLQVSN